MDNLGELIYRILKSSNLFRRNSSMLNVWERAEVAKKNLMYLAVVMVGIVGICVVTLVLYF